MIACLQYTAVAFAPAVGQGWKDRADSGQQGTNVMRIVTYVAIAVGLIGAASAGAQTKRRVQDRYSNDYNRCMNTGDAANGVTSGIMDCNGLEIDRQDARLNQAYKMVMARSNSQQKTGLRMSERNWIGQRDARCQRASASEEGGSLTTIIYSGCILEETIKRIIWLETYKG